MGSCCTTLRVAWMHKPLLRKDLIWLDQTPFRSFYRSRRVLLIDDDPIKCTENPAGTAIHPCSLEDPWNDGSPDELLKVSSYLRALVESGCRSCAEFVLANPFDAFALSQNDDTLPPGKRRRVEEHAQDTKNEGSTYESGELVEGFWPDTSVWLPAIFLSVLDDGQINIQWIDDGSESTLPPQNVRRVDDSVSHETKGHGWQRMESRSTPGNFY